MASFSLWQSDLQNRKLFPTSQSQRGTILQTMSKLLYRVLQEISKTHDQWWVTGICAKKDLSAKMQITEQFHSFFLCPFFHTSLFLFSYLCCCFVVPLAFHICISFVCQIDGSPHSPRLAWVVCWSTNKYLFVLIFLFVNCKCFAINFVFICILFVRHI